MRKLTSWLLCLVMLMSMGVSTVLAAEITQYLKPSDFKDSLGTWTIVPAEAESFGEILKAPGKKPATVVPAVIGIEVEKAGEYYIWARTRDYVGGTDSNGVPLVSSNRNFQMEVNGNKLSKVFGTHAINGWAWESAGAVQLNAGKNVIKMLDTKSYYGRCEAIAITTDKNFVGPSTKEALTEAFAKNAAKVVAVDAAMDTAPVTLPEGSTVVLVDDKGNMDFKADKVYYSFTPERFKDSLGGWKISTDVSGSYRTSILQGGAGAKVNEDASLNLKLPKDTIYYVWVHSRDFVDRSGIRTFQIKLNDTTIGTAGRHGQDGWAWESVGSSGLRAGDYTLKMVDSSGQWPRVDMIFITDDSTFVPGNGMEQLLRLENEYAFDASKVAITGGDDSDRPNDEIAVKFNGTYMDFDVPPVLLNGRTLVPMRAIFEALGCSVSWNSQTETASGERNGKIVSVSIGSDTARIGDKYVEIDQPPILQGGRTLVPLRFVSEAFGCTVDWDDKTKTVIILATEVKLAHYIIPNNFTDMGTWVLSGSFLQGLATGSNIDEADGSDSKPATVKVNIKKTADYKLWVRDRDYATNQPGTRSFHVAVDGKQVDKKFGAHGKEGFFWSEAGVFHLEKGVHELSLLDTSGFYARCEGLFLTEDLTLVPPEDKEAMYAISMPLDPFSDLPAATFPTWAKEDVASVKTDSIENDSVKIVFHQGEGQRASLVQNEIYVKDGEQWIAVKNKTEELGFLMMSALDSKLSGETGEFSLLSQTIEIDGQPASTIVENYFKSGIPVWFIPSDFEKTADNKIVLSFPNSEADLKVTMELDSLTDDPKVTLDAKFAKKGAYSFMLYSGNGVKYEDFDTVTAPLLYVKKTVPEEATILPECYLFTPMATLHLPKDNTRVTGKELTFGVVMDPTSVTQDFSYPDTSKFGLVLRSPLGNVRPQLVAPMFGNENCMFESGESYSVSYRIVNRLEPWYDTYKHISQNMYNLSDVRTNYYHSVNEAIYNATDLMMDDDFGGWDPEIMAHYNMEERDLATTANAMTAVQRYLLTENEELLDKRAVPTLAYLLSRKHFHFKATDNKGGANYISTVPSPMGGMVTNYSASVYGGLYEMTQGRMPFLLLHATNNVAGNGNLAGVTDNYAMYKYTKDESYLKKVVELADQYLVNYPNAPKNRESRFISGFIYGDYIPMVTTFLAAYEATKEQKYLDAANECAQLLTTGVWTTGYQNDYATNEYTIIPEVVGARKNNADRYTFWWHGDKQWRLGNPDGQAKSPYEAGFLPEEETAPGWLSAKAGLGTEHPRTPGHGNIIYMNNWAGMLLKLSVYTGDEFFETMARNAMIGRFGNYAGYYQDRYIFHQMKEDYPYVGPDYTSIYWHHIPVFISMLEDFLINSAWVKSEQNISFPSIYQSGYAYFASNQFGQAAGKFYDQDGMWLWLDRGIIKPDSVEIDYIAARKDGVLGLALMNEGNAAKTTIVTLGDKIPGGSGYSGKATVYTENGTKSEIDVSGGKFTIEIPSKGMRSVVLTIPGVKKPAYVNTYSYSNSVDSTVSQHTRGAGHVIQIAPNSYHAYVYISDMNHQTSKLKITYKIGDQQFTAEKQGYPYEFLIKVDDLAKSFSYELEATGVNGLVEKLGGGTLKPLAKFDGIINTKSPAVTPSAALKGFKAFNVKVQQPGMNPGLGTIRLVVGLTAFPFELSENILRGLRVTGTFTHKTEGTKLNLDTIIEGNEMRETTTVIVIKPTKDVLLFDYKDYNIELTIHPAE